MIRSTESPAPVADDAHISNRIASATHRCKVCDARWIKFDWGWSLASKQCGKCCDVVAMGEQIEPIGFTADIEEYANLTEKLSNLLARLHRPAVDDAMVVRAVSAYLKHMEYYTLPRSLDTGMRAALLAALGQVAP